MNKIQIIFYVMICILLYFIAKPSITFKPNNKLREYGFGIDTEGYKKTIYTMHNIILIIIFSFVYLSRLI